MSTKTKSKYDYWLKNISNDTRKKSLSIILEIANRMKEPDYVRSIVQSPMNTTLIGEYHPWDPLTLSHGFPGTILLFAELNKVFPEHKWDQVAHDHLVELTDSINSHGISNVSLFGGGTGIAFATSQSSLNRTRYKNFLGKIDGMILTELSVLLKNERIRLSKEHGVNPMLYDVIQGVSGIGRYLLTNLKDPAFMSSLKDILHYLVFLTEDIVIDGCTVPGWFVPNKYQFISQDKSLYPNGNFNCGLSHGITGPLSLLSLSLSANVEVEGQIKAIKKISNWLLYWKQKTEIGPSWPDRISYKEMQMKQLNHNYSNRASWCYGDPGVARALHLSGDALNDLNLKKEAFDTYKKLANYSTERFDLISPTFCHGKAGILQMFSRMSKDTEDFSNTIERLFSFLQASYNPNHPFGFKDIEKQDNNTNLLDKAGLLEGISGILLSLLTLLSTDEPTWDNAFLIS